ncbi:zinc-binding dehydrogenase [Streptomyces sp. A7024]|uniref:Zinc-binding dehydrogenase n=1 Tax=Streptomyces coryli TaxID=1128680 RepID=A0A6G4U5X7_9ACTN|nr:zinc-binding dehydrogenase [Streptomyces coryli]NGN67140.1 zinc-binding dehydrogenase [Streptomyces coryli]
MHAVVLHEFGPAENLRYEPVPDPEPGPGQVRIAVRAAGVHFVDTVMRNGPQEGAISPPPPDLPAIFGGEVAGVVDAVGDGVDADWIGRRVVTKEGKPGGYAELAVADVTDLHRIPDAMDDDTAAATIVTGTTAVSLLDLAELTAEDVVLVTSAAGGIGRLVVQHARHVGAKVVGAAGGPAKTAAVRELGADLAVDYNEPGWDKSVRDALGGRRVTAVLDGVGGDKARAAYATLADGGRFLTIGASSQQGFGEPDPELLTERGQTYTNALLHMLEHYDELLPAHTTRALEAAAEGRLVPSVQAFPLAEAAAAHAALEERRTTGKVLLKP